MLADQGTEGPQLGCTYIQLDATKTSRLESLDQIKARLGPARSVVDADRLALSPQCGFATSVVGNAITAEAQRAKVEPALTSDRWPWPHLNVLVLCSQRPPGISGHVVTDSDPALLLDKLWAASKEAASTSPAARARSIPSAPSQRSTSSKRPCCRCCSRPGCG